MVANCSRCLLPILSQVSQASETSLLFASLHCQCHKRGENARKSNGRCERCSVCGKAQVDQGRQGSFTGFLFQEFRCQCKKSHLKNKDSLATQYHPAQADQLRRTRQEQVALARTQMVLSSGDSQAIHTLQAGEVVAGSYILEEKIAQGGMGMVFKARHRLLGRPCALKFLLPSVISPASWEMFKREAKILNELEHPALCKIYDMGLHQGKLPFYAMEYLSGLTLEDLLNRQKTISLGATLEIFIAIGGALAYSHRQKIIHRDVKPANIMLVPGQVGTKDDARVSIKLLDFGIAEFCETVSAPKEIIGSASYMSPEQFSGQAITPATDIYSLGCSLFEALSGRVPFAGLDFEELAREHQQEEAPSLRAVTGYEFPEKIEAILHHALRKDPERRYRYMTELVVDLERLAEDKPLQFAKLDELEYLALDTFAKKKGGKRNRSLLLLGAGVAGGIALLLGGAIAFSQLRSHAGGADGKTEAFVSKSETSGALRSSAGVGELGTALVPGSGEAGSLSSPLSQSSPASDGVRSNDYALIQEVADDLEVDPKGTMGSTLQESNDSSPARVITAGKIILQKLQSNAYKNVPGLGIDYDAYLKSCASPEAYLASTVPASVVITEGKAKVRVFLFPKRSSLGYLHLPYKMAREKACDFVVYPADTAVDIQIDSPYSSSPGILKRFDAQAIDWLTLVNAVSLPDLRPLASWKNLDTLEFGWCKLSLADFVQLKKLARITRLNIIQCDFALTDLQQSHVLDALDSFVYSPRTTRTGFKNVLALLATKEHRLTKLVLEGELKREEIAMLASMKSVASLRLKGAQLDDEKLTLLSQLKYIDELNLEEDDLKNCSAPTVAKLRAALGSKLKNDDYLRFSL